MKNHPLETYETLRDKILSGEFRPSQQIIASKLAEDLGTSRDHIRMAFQRLEVEGLIEIKPNQSAVVSDISLEYVLDVFEVRAVLEAEAYRRAFERMTDAGIKKLEALLDQMRRAIGDKNFDLYSASSLEFQEVVLELSGNPYLRKLVAEVLVITKGRLRNAIIPLRGESSLVEHENIVQALRGDSAEAVVAAVHTHLSNVSQDLKRYWDIIKP